MWLTFPTPGRGPAADRRQPPRRIDAHRNPHRGQPASDGAPGAGRRTARRDPPVDLGDGAGPDQPRVWTVIDFEADDSIADRLAQALAAALAPDGGWYCDFAVGDERVVVFADAVFRFPRGDAAGRARAVAHGLSVGVPAHQLDWAD